jgi:hypothetical protein
MRSEQQVREAVAELNSRIMDWRRLPLGPPIFVPLVDEGKMVGLWRAAQPRPAAAGHERATEPVRQRPRRWPRRPRG